MATLSATGVQTGTKTLTNGNTSTTQTITSVTTSKALLFISVKTPSTGGLAVDCCVRAELTNATTITFTRSGTTGDLSIVWYVIEWSSGVTVQRGTQASVGNPTNVTISALGSLTKSFAYGYFYTATGTPYGVADGLFTNAELTTTTNLALSHYATGQAGAITSYSWQVAEYDNCSVQKFVKAVTGTSATQTITAVTTTKAFLISDGSRFTTMAANTDGNGIWQHYLNSSTQIAWARESDEGAGQCVIYAVDVSDSIAVQRARTARTAAGTTATAAITAVNLSRAIITLCSENGHLVRCQNGSQGEQYDSSFSANINSTTQVTFIRGAANVDANISWEVIEWPASTNYGTFGFDRLIMRKSQRAA